jgi:hypothetical protein
LDQLPTESVSQAEQWLELVIGALSGACVKTPAEEILVEQYSLEFPHMKYRSLKRAKRI